MTVTFDPLFSFVLVSPRTHYYLYPSNEFIHRYSDRSDRVRLKIFCLTNILGFSYSRIFFN